MTDLTPPHPDSVNPAETESPNPAEFRVSPFYHSAVNAVTRPDQFVACSRYFVERWMPILGNEGTRIVLALRALGYHNPKTGETRDEIPIDLARLAQLVGCSVDTIGRELGDDKKTSKPKNWALRQFVEKRRRIVRDRFGRVKSDENAYQVAMDDPIHPDDWPLVQQAVVEREARAVTKDKGVPSNPQSAEPGQQPKPQNAEAARQNADRPPQNASPKPQNAEPLMKTRARSTLSSSENLPLFTAALPGVSPTAVSGVGAAWTALTEPERQTFRDRADAELAALHTDGWGSVRHKERLVETRAQSLFALTKKDTLPIGGTG